jgi:hypothetical protein
MLLLGRRAVRIAAGILAIRYFVVFLAAFRELSLSGHYAVDNNLFSLSLSTTIPAYENS